MCERCKKLEAEVRRLRERERLLHSCCVCHAKFENPGAPSYCEPCSFSQIEEAEEEWFDAWETTKGETNGV